MSTTCVPVIKSCSSQNITGARQTMRTISIRVLSAVTLILLFAGAAFASDPSDVMKPVHQFIDGFNKGDAKSAIAACADEASIIDEFSPYEWHGAGACSTW